MRKSYLKNSEKLLPIGKNPQVSYPKPTGSSIGMITVFSLVLTCVVGGLLIWNIVETQQLLHTTSTADTTTTPASSSYNPVIFKLLTSNSISLQGSTVNGDILNVPVYQYVGLQKSQLPQIDSIQTPHTVLPLFSSLFLTATFSSTIENGDVISHAYYPSPVITNAVNPIAAVYFTYYQSCFFYDNSTNFCWTGTDFCTYPFVIGFGTPNIVSFDNFAEVLAYAQTNFDSNVRANPSNGCFYVTVDNDLVNPQIITQLTQNLTVITPNGTGDPFILQVLQQYDPQYFTLLTSPYTSSATFPYFTGAEDFFDFYIDYGDGSPFEHHVGTFGVDNVIRHHYTGDPKIVIVTIMGILPSWNSVVTEQLGDGYEPMTRDVLSWGNVSMKQCGFYYEENMVALSAGPPPSSITDFLYFFSSSAEMEVWANLNTWNSTNIVDATRMFYRIYKGVLDLRGWTLPNLKYGSQMFYQVTIPVIGGLQDATLQSLQYGDGMFYNYRGSALVLSNTTFPSLIIANYMFFYFDSTEIDLSHILPHNLQSAVSMFQYTSNFANLNITYWTTENLQDIQNMFFACDGIKPVFTYWNMQNITSCAYAILGSSQPTTRQISSSADYNQILIDFESKTNSTGLICYWAVSGSDDGLPINGNATGAGLVARTNLINRGWNIQDLRGLN